MGGVFSACCSREERETGTDYAILQNEAVIACSREERETDTGTECAISQNEAVTTTRRGTTWSEERIYVPIINVPPSNARREKQQNFTRNQTRSTASNALKQNEKEGIFNQIINVPPYIPPHIRELQQKYSRNVRVPAASIALKQNENRSCTRLDVERKRYDPNYFPVHSNISFGLGSVYQILPISIGETEYDDIKRRITNKHFKVHSIERIENKFLENSYSLKKKQKMKEFPHLEELELFHGTKWTNADKICINNFNWRFHGTGTGHRYGQGVSFSCNAMYAANYSKDDLDKVMFIAKVLIGKKCLGDCSMNIPKKGYDTSTKQDDNIVVVKYEDNEFYPVYRIRFHISPGYVPMNKRKMVKYQHY